MFLQARRRLQAAILIERMVPEVAAQQAYLGMFASARGRLAASGLEIGRSHKSVHRALYSLYRDGEQNPAAILQQAYAWKQFADYGDGERPTGEAVNAAVALSQAYVDRMIRDSGYDPATISEPATPPDIVAALWSRSEMPPDS